MSNTNEYQHALDATEMMCPMPLLKTRLLLQRMQAGECLLVTATDPGSWQDIPKYIRLSGHQLLHSKKNAQQFSFLIQKG